MAKETMKAKIERLESELEQAKNGLALEKNRNEELTQRLYQAQENYDDTFRNSPYCKQLEQEIERLQQYREMSEKYKQKYEKERKKYISLHEEIQKLKNKEPKKIHNERNAGRKCLEVPQEILENMIDDRENGMSYKRLAQKYSYSVGTVHKLINKQNERSERDIVN